MKKWEYEDALERIEQENPCEVLLGVLRTGWSPVNVIYMKSALKRLESAPKKDVPADEIPADEGFLKGKYRRQQTLRGERNKLSNSFHTCTTDAQRAAVSAKIIEIETEIRRNEVEIRRFELDGETPFNTDSELESPTDPVVLLKKIASLRAMISQTKKRLEYLASLNASNPEKSAIPNVEKRLADLKNQLKTAENAINAHQKTTK